MQPKVEFNFYGVKNWKQEDCTDQWISSDVSLKAAQAMI